MSRHTPARAILAGMVLLLVASCGQPAPTKPAATGPATPPSTAPAPTTARPSPSPQQSAQQSAQQSSPTQGIDVSRHQGPIQWSLVAGSGIAFAYLKATEGASFIDPMFALNATKAQPQGIRVGGYHYFRYCSPALPQARHFSVVLAQTPTDLPPALDVERDRCRLDRAQLLERVQTFMTEVEKATGKAVVLYVYPDLEAELQLRRDFPHNPQWVRSLGRRPPGNWWLWQRSDRGTVAGIAGRVDLNVMREP